MKIIKIEREPSSTYLPNDNRLGTYHITYKLKGNKHHKMTVFAHNEMQALVKAIEANETNQGVIALQKLSRRIE